MMIDPKAQSSALHLVGLGSGNVLQPPGIHLRWMFNSKMGFPPFGFSLFRRKSDTRKKILMKADDIPAQNFTFPFNFTTGTERRVTFSIHSTPNDFSVKMVNYTIGRSIKAFVIKNSVRIYFSLPTSAVQFDIIPSISSATPIEITAFSQQNIVSRQLFLSQRGLLSINAKNIDCIELKGQLIQIQAVSYWFCDEAGADWGKSIINNEQFGAGLPYGPAEVQAYNRTLFRTPNATEDELANKIISCRMSTLTPETLDDYKKAFKQMQNEGTLVPIGWNSIAPQGENDDDPQAPKITLSAYDAFLLHSQLVPVARLLGLYWVDQTADPGTDYDYKVVGKWPEGFLWHLENEILFSRDDQVYNLFEKEGADGISVSFIGPSPSVVPITDGELTHGLTFKSSGLKEITLQFSAPIGGIQIFYSSLTPPIEALGYTNFSQPPIDRAASKTKSGILALHGPQLKAVKILATDLTILRIRYDKEALFSSTQQDIIYAIRKDTVSSLPSPQNVQITPLADPVAHRFRAALKWGLEGIDDPVGYLIKRGDTLLTQNPLYLAKEEFSTERPYYYLDTLSTPGRYTYSVCSVDLFGRHSPWSVSKDIVITEMLLSAPQNVKAKFIESPNPTVSISWEYSIDQPLLSLRNLKFKLFFLKGWLNLAQGLINKVVPLNPDTYQCLLSIDAPQNFGQDTLKDEWLRQGKELFHILSNEPFEGRGDVHVVLKKASFAHSPSPQENQPYTLPLTKIGSGVDYRNPEKWKEEFSKEIRLDDPALQPVFTPSDANEHPLAQFQYTYSWMLPPSTQFPSWQNSSQPPQNKIEYAQIGISTINSEGKSGAVSIPATILATYRNPPLAVATSPSASHSILQATRADIYGKSSFALTFPTSPGLRYDIFRAMDETLFAAQDYLSWSPETLQRLASEKGDAFTKLTSRPITPTSAGDYTYVDTTLDGKSHNLYFYRIQAIDEIGNRSPLGPSTDPVEIPLSSPPPSPRITHTAVNQGIVTLHWINTAITPLKGYRVYRTENALSARDIRKMSLVYPIDSSSASETLWADHSVQEGKSYYYRLVAIDAQDNVSSPSDVTYIAVVNNDPPPPPAWKRLFWVDTSNSICLQWENVGTPTHFLIKRKRWGDLTWKPLSIEDKIETSSPTEYQFYDESVSRQDTYTYAIAAISPTGVVSEIFNEQTIVGYGPQ